MIVYIKVVNALGLVVSLHSATDVQGEGCVEQLAFLEYAVAYASSSATQAAVTHALQICLATNSLLWSRSVILNLKRQTDLESAVSSAGPTSGHVLLDRC